MVYSNLKNLFFEKLKSKFNKLELEGIWQYCIDFALKSKKEFFVLNQNYKVSENEIAIIDNVIKRLENAEPIQYIFCKAYFAGEVFDVNKNVLIPRPETDELVNLVLSKISNKSSKIIDIGTGSGCIAVTLKKKLPEAIIYAIDISPDAIEIAKQNENNIITNASINFIKADVTDRNFSKLFSTKFDIIISNPPYIGLGEKKDIEENVLKYEPHIALFSKYDPLKFYKHILFNSRKILNSNGMIFLEINSKYARQIEELCANNSFKQIEILKDFNGNERFATAVKI